MVTIESTPELAAKVYDTMTRTLERVRRRLGRPLTLADKVLLGHLDDPDHQEMEPGRSYLCTPPRPRRPAGRAGADRHAPVHADAAGRRRRSHHGPLRSPDPGRVEGERDLRASLEENQEVYGFLRSAAAKYGVGFWGPGAGIIHQVVLENYAFPGELIIGTDSHTPNAGGLGACAVGVGGADAVEVMAGLPWEVLYPRHIAVYLTGTLSGWTAPKDVILYVAGAADGGRGHQRHRGVHRARGPDHQRHRQGHHHQHGSRARAPRRPCFPTTRAWPPTCARRAGATSCPSPSGISSCSRPTPRSRRSPRSTTTAWSISTSSKLEPHVVGPHSPDRARPISGWPRRWPIRPTASPTRSPRRSSAAAPTPRTRT